MPLRVVFLFIGLVVQVSCLQFNYTKFEDSDVEQFILTKQVSYIYQGALQITPDTANKDPSFLANKSGRILYKETFKLWKKNESDASFNTSFLLNIQNRTYPGGDGLAFILTNYPDVPINSYGPWLGIVNQSTDGSSSNRIVAIEFDTRKSGPSDIDDNHVALNVNCLSSSSDDEFSLGRYGVNLSNGFHDVFVKIGYDAKLKQMVVNLSMGNDTTVDHFNASKIFQIDLSRHLLSDVYVGFSGSTSNFTESNCVKSWNFSGVDIGRGYNRRLVLLILLMIPFVSFVGIFSYCRLSQKRTRAVQTRGSRVESILVDSTNGPLKFRLKDLKSATSNFHPNKKLGQGGFGTVYKGFLKDIKCQVAVKRLSKDSECGGEEDFIAEVTTISRLHHKNLVKLIGWCCERDELLLVYKFMPGGSLDKLIFPNQGSTTEATDLLSWENRHKIIHGVASALNYLHYGCEKRVLHRDIKASNVMLDSNYNPQLGDFGLARTIQQEGKTHHSTRKIAGTPGYIAPEYIFTSRAGVETDVYGFGVFTMEVVCGRRPGVHGNKDYIVDRVWELYTFERLFEAVDRRLDGGFDEAQAECMLMLGLACCHPNPYERPSMGVALLVLNGEALPPVLPKEKPAFVWPVVQSIRVNNPDGFELSPGRGYLTSSTELSGR